MSVNVLVVDDEPSVREAISYALSRAAMNCELAEDARQAERAIETANFDLVLLDWMLPDFSGIELAQRLKSNPRTAPLPIIMLTARGEEEDKVRGFDVGADDYVTKPFSPRELVARIRAVLRRSGSPTAEVVQIGDLVLEVANHRVHVDGTELELSSTEFELLQVLMGNPDRVFTRTQLLDLAWPRNIHVGERTVDVHISALRKALEPLTAGVQIQTVRGVGYRFSTKR
jgi:two-component system phosphate regulon response regulator PhoB